MSYTTLELQRDGAVTWLILNRPDRLNAISDTLLTEYGEAIRELGADPETSVIVVRGAGRAFCSGYDVAADAEETAGLQHRSIIEDRARLERNIEILMEAWRCPKPVIAAVHGHCMAGGAQLATLCDITVVADDAIIGMPSLPLGGGYISPMWVPLMGPKRAKQMSFLTGGKISGAQAASWGWANFSCPAESLFDEVAELARQIALTPVEVLSVKKAAVNRAADIAGWSTIMPLGAETDALLHRSPTVQRVNRHVLSHGLKESIRGFAAGEMDEWEDE